jgi:hypothetical protein
MMIMNTQIYIRTEMDLWQICRKSTFAIQKVRIKK